MKENREELRTKMLIHCKFRMFVPVGGSGDRFFLSLLGDRERESFRIWLDQHPDISVVSRDRSTDYSAARASTQRDIIGVADRFHLIKNLSDKISKLINEKFAD